MKTKIPDFSGLKKGWDSYNAEVPTENSINVATMVASIMEVSFDLPPDRIAADVNGGVGITLRRNGKMLYVWCLNNGKWCAIFGNDGPGDDTLTFASERMNVVELMQQIKPRLTGDKS